MQSRVLQFGRLGKGKGDGMGWDGMRCYAIRGGPVADPVELASQGLKRDCWC
jgi:hypothetical protein